MKKIFILFVLILSFFQAEMPASSHAHKNHKHHSHKHKHHKHKHKHKPKSTNDIVKHIDKTTTQDLAVDQQILSTVVAIEACACSCLGATIITADQINKASATSPNGFVISTPGEYKLCGDVNWSVATPSSFAITISASDVTLDLGGGTITQLNTALAQNFAIQVAGTTEEILVKNGLLQTLSGGGILVQAGAKCVTIDGIKCNKCAYNGPTTLGGSNGVWGAAILISGTPTNLVSDVVVTNCEICDTGLLGTIPQFITGSISGSTLTVTPTAVVTGTISTTSSTILNVTSVTSGRLFVGQPIFGAGVTPGTTIDSYITGTGGAGTYTLSISSTVSTPETIVTGPFEPINVGEVVTGNGVAPGTTITAMVSPVAYTVSIPQTVASETMTISDPKAAFIPKGNVSPLFASYAENVVFKNIIAQTAWGEFTMYGITAMTSHSIFMSNIVVNGLRTFGLSKSIFVKSCQDVLVEDFDISNQLMYVTPTLTKTRGIGAEGIKLATSNNVTLLRGSFSRLYVKTQVPAPAAILPGDHMGTLGITTSGGTSQAVIQDCTFQDFFNDGGQNTANSPGVHAAGFLTNQGSDMHFSNCTASNISASLGFSYGFAEETFTGITSDQFGFINNTFTDCTVNYINITGNSTLGGTQAAGFRLLGKNDEVIGCNVDQVRDLRVSGSGIPNAYGILLDTFPITSPPFTQTASACNIMNNIITNCATGGIFDVSTANRGTLNNIISGNIASYNGTPITPTSNYTMGAWNAQVDWFVSSALPPAAAPNPMVDNMNIH